ncbi:PAS domain S-box protein [Singulisphaera sp. Ch08]|uniref:Sensory/regulatory protein RpfC n=1 Tax=Singulisphaera sp. Ch08 TaxID=3120278 RepID=A0AAU7C9A1_9BACT
MHDNPRARRVAYGVALLNVVVAILVQRHLTSILGDRALYITFFPAILVAAYLGGFWPGFLATALSAMAVAFFFIEPLYALRIKGIADATTLPLFLLIGTVISVLSEALHRAWRRIVAEERNRAEEVMERLFNLSLDLICIAGTDGYFKRVNPAFHHVLGWAERDLIAQPFLHFVHPDDVEATLREMQTLSTGVPTTSFENRYRNIDGTYKHLVWSASPELRTGLIYGIARDVTQAKLAERELQRAKEATEAAQAREISILESITDAFYALDRDWRFTYLNPKASSLLSPLRGNLLGKVFWEEFPEAIGSTFGRNFHEARDTGRTVTFEEYYPPLELWFEARVYPSAEGLLVYFRDMTERKQAEKALRDSEHRWRSLTEAIPQLIWTTRPDGVADYFSSQCTKYSGLPESELLIPGRWLELLHPEDREYCRKTWADSVKEGRNHEVEMRIRRSDGAYRWFNNRGVAVRDNNGTPTKWIDSCTDIHEIKHLEEERRENQERLQAALSASRTGTYRWNIRTGAVDSDESLNHLFGLAPGQSLNQLEDFFRLIHPEDLAPAVEKCRRCAEEGADFVMDFRVNWPNGSLRWLADRSKTYLDADGRPLYVTGACVDITDRKRVEDELRHSEELFRNYFELSLTPMAITTPEKNWIQVNDKLCELLDYTREELRTLTWDELTHSDDLATDIGRFEELMRGEIDGYSLEKRFVSKKGRLVSTIMCVRAVSRDDGTTEYCLAQLLDITPQKQIEKELRQAKEAAESANHAKDVFLANVSHEIRTPMNAILGMTELTLDTPLSEDQRKHLMIVKTSAEALLSVINDLLDFSKIEAGKLELDFADFSLRRVLGETLRALAFRAHRKGLELVCQIQPDVPDPLIGDAGRLRQVLLNLIGNAIKFTEQGEVVVRVESEPTDSVLPGPGLQPSQGLRFSIRDTGIGISLDKQSKIFQAFEQADPSTTRKYGGTGLGLSIASQLVALMDGQITLESTPGQGSTFCFTVHFAKQAHPTDHPFERPLVDLNGLRVLIVDDNATNRQILEESLRGWKTEPMAVGDGLKALDALWRGVALGRPFSLVLLDARMPGTDGLALAARILQSPELSASRIILLTSEDLHGDIARYRALGIAAYTMKPVQQEELLEIIHRVLSRPTPAELSTPTATAITTAPGESTRRLRVLVAEDNPLNQELVEHLLRRRGHDVVVVGDGQAALATLDQDQFDLSLLDVHMPEFDGFQVIEALRHREQSTGGHLPVIAMTALAMKGDHERCLQAGMDDYLAKPIRASDLFAVIDRVLAAHPEPHPRPQPQTLLDPGTLQAACDDDPTLLGKLCLVFLAKSPDALARVRNAIIEGDSARLQEAAHHLRGLLSTFSATAAHAALKLEEVGASGQLDAAPPILDGLTEMVRRLVPLLDNLSIEQLRRYAENGGSP